MKQLERNECEPSTSQRQRDLLHAVQEGTLENVEKLWNQFLDVNEDEETFKYLLLVSALKRRDSWISKFLIEKNCPVRISTRTESNSTPLYYATLMGDRDIYKDLYLRGASIHDRDAYQVSALELALLKGGIPCDHDFLDKIMRLDHPESLDPNCNNDVSLFHTACWYNHVPAVEMFVARGFSVRSRSVFISSEFRGFTPLHFALKKRALKVVRFLLQHDVDFHATDSHGNTSLHLAFQMRWSIENSPGIREVVRAYVSLPEDSIHNSVDQSGLSHFHILCAVNFKEKWTYRPNECEMEDDDNVDVNTSQNRLKLLTYFIKSKIDIDECAFPGKYHYREYAALHFAACHCCSDVLKLLLENGADPTTQGRRGDTPLHVVSREFSDRVNKDSLNVINLLIESGLDIDTKNSRGETALHRAFHRQWRNQNFIHFLISKSKFDVDFVGGCGLSYLHIACTGDDLSIVERLITNGASIEACLRSDLERSEIYSKFPWEGCSALHFAIKFNKPEIVEYLLKLGADVHNSNNKYMTTPLHLACCYELSRFFSSFDEQDITSVDWVTNRSNNIRIVELLLEYGASVNARSSSGKTPLYDIFEDYQYGSHHGSYVGRIEKEVFISQQKITEILLFHGAEINNCNGDKNPPLLHRIHYRFVNESARAVTLIELLLKNGANVDSVDKDNLTPLHHAIKFLPNSLPVVDLYIKYGANVNTLSSDLHTPLYAAVENVYCYLFKVVDKLLSHPYIDVNAGNCYGATPLHAVMRIGMSCGIGKLLSAGADMDIKDKGGYVPLHYLYLLREEVEDNCKEKLKECVTIALNHVKKLIKLKRSVSQENRFYFEKLLENHELHDSVEDDIIDAEVSKLKSCKIDQYTSLYNILQKNSNDMSKHVENCNLLRVVLSAKLPNDFPLFHDLLVKQYERGVIRRGLLNRAQEALKLVTNVEWPDSCSESILKYFDNNHMNIFIECIFGKNSNKRSQLDSPSSDRCPAKSPKCEEIE